MMLPEAEIRIGKGMKAWNKTIYPIIEVSVLKTEASGIQASWIVPLAVLVVEPGEQGEHYVLSLTEEKTSAEMMARLAPALREVVDRSRGIHRIKVS
jgi:hypothetical protein